MDIAIIDYGAGNTQSVIYALERLGVNPIVTANSEVISQAEYVIFPGVGNAEKAMQALKQTKLDLLIPELKQPVLGICLGMQLLCNVSEEGNVKGLGVFDTAVTAFKPTVKIPHMGWNQIEFDKDCPLLKNVVQQANVYFVHSFYAAVNQDCIATANYGGSFSAALQKNNFYGCQFHPEKSGEIGNQILKNFIKL